MGPVHLTVGPDGAIWFTGYSSNEIGRMTPDGVLTDRYPVPTPDSQPYQIVIGPDGAIWFTEIQGDSSAGIQLPAAARLPRTGGAAPPVPTWLLALGRGRPGSGPPGPSAARVEAASHGCPENLRDVGHGLLLGHSLTLLPTGAAAPQLAACATLHP